MRACIIFDICRKCALAVYCSAVNVHLKYVRTCRIFDICSKCALAVCCLAANAHLKHVRRCRMCDICRKCALAVCCLAANAHLKHVQMCSICDTCSKCALAVCCIAVNAHLKHVRTHDSSTSSQTRQHCICASSSSISRVRCCGFCLHCVGTLGAQILLWRVAALLPRQLRAKAGAQRAEAGSARSGCHSRASSKNKYKLHNIKRMRVLGLRHRGLSWAAKRLA